MSRVTVEYRLQFEDRTAVSHLVEITEPGAADHDLRPQPELPSWTRLDRHQCPNCPYDRDRRAHCPVAVKLAPLIEKLGSYRSYDAVALEVRTSERRILAESTLQRAISSLFGLVIASSDCPHTRFLLPMARYHLPLASEGETIYRVAGMYLLGLYLRDHDRQRERNDEAFEELRGHYRELGIVNRALAERMKQASREDASVNAVVLLDLLARIVPDNIDSALEELRRWYPAASDAT